MEAVIDPATGEVVVVDEAYEPAAGEIATAAAEAGGEPASATSDGEPYETTVFEGAATAGKGASGDGRRIRDDTGTYIIEAARVPLLDAEQEVELAKRIEAGVYAKHKLETEPGLDEGYRGDLELVAADGLRARNHMLEANLRLVISIAKRKTGKGLPLLDLVQHGNLGLIRAVEKFDYTKGYKFSTYASWWVKQAIQRGLADEARTIRIPIHMVEDLNKLSRMRLQMYQDLGREPTPEELAPEVGMTPEKVVDLIRIGEEPLSLDVTLDPGNPNSTATGDAIEEVGAWTPQEIVEVHSLSADIEHVLASLPTLEAEFVLLRFGLYDGRRKTLDEIGKLHGRTREQVRKIESMVMTKLRHPAMSYVLRAYLD